MENSEAPAYFVTLDLGQLHGPKLERLAAQESFDDVEAFAAMLLRHAIDLEVKRLQPDKELGEALPF